MSPRPLSVGLVGCGRLAELGYVPAIGMVGGLELVAVADPDRTRRDDLASRVASAAAARASRPVATYRSAAEMLSGTEVDVVILASPASAHVGDAAMLARAGVEMLVEKPPAPDAASAAELASVAPRAWIGFNRRFDAGARTARDSVPSDGPIDVRLAISYRRRGWGAHAVRDDAILDLGPHLVDLARWLGACDVTEVSRCELRPDRATIRLTLARGGIATVRAFTERPHREQIEVRDASGAVRARHQVGGVVDGVRGRLTRGSDPHPLVHSLANQLRALADSVSGTSHRDLATVGDGHAVMSVIDAARASSADGGRPVPVVATVAS